MGDVAQMAGVSESTVSLVLAGKGGLRRISQDTDLRVRTAAQVLRYTPSILHQSLKRGHTHVISLYNAFRVRDRADLYMNELSAAISHASGKRGYDVLLHSNFQRDVRETYEFLNGGLADGLVLFGPSADEPLLPLLGESKLPTVVIGPRREETTLSTVTDDEEMGMKMIAEALVSNGHRRIAAVVESVGGILDPTGRLRRLERELEARNIPIDPQSILVWSSSGTEAIQRLMALPKRPTALFVWHDRTAYKLVAAAESLGISVPKDLSIVGYDGLIWPSPTPHIVTSVRVPMDEMAEATIEMLHRLIERSRGEGVRPPLKKALPVEFFPGTTLGPAILSHSFQ